MILGINSDLTELEFDKGKGSNVARLFLVRRLEAKSTRISSTHTHTHTLSLTHTHTHALTL